MVKEKRFSATPGLSTIVSGGKSSCLSTLNRQSCSQESEPSGYLNPYQSFLWIKFDVKGCCAERAHAQTCHLRRVVLPLKDSEFEHGPDEVFRSTEFLSPFSKGLTPLLCIFQLIVTPIEDESELVVTVVKKAVDAG